MKRGQSLQGYRSVANVMLCKYFELNN